MKNISTKHNRGNRGQVWTMDFIIGITLFIIVMLLSVRILLTIYPSQEHIRVYRDAVQLSDSLLSPGYPVNWNTSNVILPGIADNNRINNTRLKSFKDMNYQHTKTLLHVTSDFIFFISNSTTIINTGQCLYGYNLTSEANCKPILTTEDYDTLARIDRMVIYNSTVYTLTVYAWE